MFQFFLLIFLFHTDFEVQFVLDSKKTKSPRMFFLSNENRSVVNKSIKLTKGQKLCENMFVFLKVDKPF